MAAIAEDSEAAVAAAADSEEVEVAVEDHRHKTMPAQVNEDS